jgi:hypothetical protein
MVAMACETRRCRTRGSRRSACRALPRSQLRCCRHPGNGPWRHDVVDRYYDPETGQFLSVDPDVSETVQPYEYAGDNPESSVDPYGTEECPNGRMECWWQWSVKSSTDLGAGYSQQIRCGGAAYGSIHGLTWDCGKSVTVGVDISGSLSVVPDLLGGILGISVSATWTISSATTVGITVPIPYHKWAAVYYSYRSRIWSISQKRELWTCTVISRNGCVGTGPYSPHKWESPTRVVTIYVPLLLNGGPQYAWDGYTFANYPPATLAPLGSSSS